MSLHSHSLRSLPETAAADKATVAVAVTVCVCVLCLCVYSQTGPTLVSADLSALNYVAVRSHKPIICPFKALEHTQK